MRHLCLPPTDCIGTRSYEGGRAKLFSQGVTNLIVKRGILLRKKGMGNMGQSPAYKVMEIRSSNICEALGSLPST